MLFRVVEVLVRALWKVMGWRLIVIGEEHLPRDGAVLLAPNHVSYLDPFMIGLAMRRRDRWPCFMAKKELFDDLRTGWLLRATRQVPVDRRGDAARSLDEAAARLRAGEAVLVFPEGTIPAALVPWSGKTGAARLALATGAPLMPVALWGGQRVAPHRRRPLLRRGIPLVVMFGEPLVPGKREDVTGLHGRLMRTLRELVDDAARSYPDRPRNEADYWWLPAHLGGSAPPPG